MSAGPYAKRGLDYLALGWRGVLPLPPGQKSPPPSNTTGSSGQDVSQTRVETWTRTNGDGNIGLRLPTDIVGIDVDAYQSKPGAVTLAALEASLGALPATWTSTSRDDGVSGIRLFRCPSGHHFPNGSLGVDIIQHHHRYVVCAPSVHPEGGTYRWLDQSGHPSDELPSPYDLAELPADWVDGLSAAFDELRRRHNTPARAEPCTPVGSSPVQRALSEALASIADGTGRHDSATQAAATLARLAERGYPDAEQALDTLGTEFCRAVTEDDSRTADVATAEWERMLTGARELIATTGATTPRWAGNRPADPVSATVESLIPEATDRAELVKALLQEDRLTAIANSPIVTQELLYHCLKAEHHLTLERISSIKRAVKAQPTSVAAVRSLAISELLGGDSLAEHHIPPGYAITRRGVFHRDRHIATSPLVIEARSQDLRSNQMQVTVAFMVGDRTVRRTVDRSTIAKGQDILALANYGAPINSANAREVIAYLSRYEHENEASLVPTPSVSQLGWTGADNRCFMLGSTQIGDESTSVQLVCADDGNRQIADAYSQSGSHDTWYALLEQLPLEGPLTIALGAGLAAPLIRLVGSRNFAVDISGQTSIGKTTTLRLVASIYGNPDESHPHGALTTMDATEVGALRRAAFQADLPLIRDDTQRAGDDPSVEGFIYNFVSGRDRERGSVTGMSETVTFHGVLLTSGEHPAAHTTRAGGTKARVITLTEPPFGPPDDRSARMVRNIAETIRTNFGTAGQMHLRHLTQTPRRSLEQRFRTKVAELDQLDEQSPVAARLAESFAAIDLAIEFAVEAGSIPEKFADTQLIQHEFLAAVEAAKVADVPLEALKATYAYAVAHGNQFAMHFNEEHPPPSSGFVGRWENLPGAPLCFLPPRLEKILYDHGFRYNEVVPAWRTRGWLETEPGRRQKTVRIDGKPVKTVAISAAALEENGISDATDEE